MAKWLVEFASVVSVCEEDTLVHVLGHKGKMHTISIFCLMVVVYLSVAYCTNVFSQPQVTDGKIILLKDKNTN